MPKLKLKNVSEVEIDLPIPFYVEQGKSIGKVFEDRQFWLEDNNGHIFLKQNFSPLSRLWTDYTRFKEKQEELSKRFYTRFAALLEDLQGSEALKIESHTLKIEAVPYE